MKSLLPVRLAFVLVVCGFLFCTEYVKADEYYEGSFPGYYTNLQRYPEQTFREGKLLRESGAEGHTIFEIPKDTFGAFKFALYNKSNQWTVGTVWLYMLPQKVYVGTRKVNIEPGKSVVVVIPTKFAISEAGVRFAYDVEYGFGKKWSGKSTLRMAKEKGTKDTSDPRRPKRGDTIRNSIGMKMVYVSPGEFLMGSSSNAKGRSSVEGPRHHVRINKGFYMSVREVTQDQWKEIMGTTISQQRDKLDSIFSLVGVGQNYPIYFISWKEATEFCRRLGRNEGGHYRLPTEAEWEYACRAGSTARYCFGDNESSLDNYAWYNKNSSKRTHVIGQKRPNVFGLYDLHGNVWEWCQDWYGENYYSTSPAVDPKGPSKGKRRVLRGGSWSLAANCSRSAYRTGSSPDTRDNDIGFRVVLEVEK